MNARSWRAASDLWLAVVFPRVCVVFVGLSVLWAGLGFRFVSPDGLPPWLDVLAGVISGAIVCFLFLSMWIARQGDRARRNEKSSR